MNVSSLRLCLQLKEMHRTSPWRCTVVNAPFRPQIRHGNVDTSESNTLNNIVACSSARVNQALAGVAVVLYVMFSLLVAASIYYYRKRVR